MAAAAAQRAVGLAAGQVAVVGILPHRVDVEFHRMAEHAAHRLENAALEVLVVFLVEDLEEVVDAHGHADHLLRIAAEVGDQPVELGIVRDERREADVPEHVDAGEEVIGVKVAVREQVVHRDLHQDKHLLPLHHGLLHEL